MNMPQETKAMPFDPDSLEHAPGVIHQSLEGLVPPLDDDAKVRAAVEQAFDYRGDVTISLTDGRVVEGYIFDRHADGHALSDCWLRLIPRDSAEKLKIRYSDMSHLAFTGRDPAAGKSFETWVRKYHQKKAAGETNIRLEPEKLD
jgi:hypothetical protein